MQSDDRQAPVPLHPFREGLAFVAAAAEAVLMFLQPGRARRRKAEALSVGRDHPKLTAKLKATVKAVAPFPVDD